MDIVTILALVNAALSFVEGVLPKIKGWFANGEITVEQQDALHARFTALRDGMNEVFAQDHWRKSDGTLSKSQGR